MSNIRDFGFWPFLDRIKNFELSPSFGGWAEGKGWEYQPQGTDGQSFLPSIEKMNILGNQTSFPPFFHKIEKFYFINLFVLFSLIESVNFAFFRKNNKRSQATQSNFTKKNHSFLITTDLFKKNALLLNPLKLGFLFGLFVDAFKVGS